jgi:hypothetical protein
VRASASARTSTTARSQGPDFCELHRAFASPACESRQRGPDAATARVGSIKVPK